MDRAQRQSNLIFLISLVGVTSIAACSSPPDQVLLECIAKVTKDEGWREAEGREVMSWRVYQDPYTSTRNKSMWEFKFTPSQLIIISDVVGDKDYCWMECGPIKRIELPHDDIIFENGTFSGRFRWFKGPQEYWEFNWRRILGVVAFASGKMSYEITDISANDPIQKEKHASIEFSC